MPKKSKFIAIIISTLLILIFIDTVQSLLFNNRPFFKIEEAFNGGTLYQKDSGFIVDTYTCINNEKKTVFKWEEYNCPDTDVKLAEDNHVEKITWEEITENGVDEELLLKNIDIDLLTQIAAQLQTLVDEAIAEERENPEILITEGWARVLNYDRFKKVLDIGTPAMKPLYLILYKSPNRGEYEYLCSYALYKLSGFDFEWSTTDEFMEMFIEKILEERKT